MSAAPRTSIHGRFVWYDQMSNDVEGAAAFYRRVVGWTISANTMNDQPYTLLSAGPAMVGGLMPIPADAAAMGVRPTWMGYVAVDDVDAAAAKIRASGGAVLREPADIPAVGRFAVAGDPHGAGFIVFKPIPPENPPATPAPGTPGTIGWRELHAGDRESDFAFYSSLFGWKKSDTFDMGAMGVYQTFESGEGQGGGMMTKTPQTPAPFWLYYFNVETMDAAVDRVKAAGGTVANGPHEVPGGQWALQGFDPQGAMFGLLAPKR